MTIAPKDKSKDTLKKYEKLWDKIRDFIRSVTNNPGNYGEKYMKMKINWDDDLPWKKTLELYNMVVVVRSISHESNKYYQQVFPDECLYKLTILVEK